MNVVKLTQPKITPPEMLCDKCLHPKLNNYELTSYLNHHSTNLLLGKPKSGKSSLMWAMMKDKKLNLGGFYPTPNPMALNSVKPEDTTSTYLAFIHDAVCLIVNKKIMLDPYVLKVDFQRTIEYYKLDGGVLRRNNYSFKTYFMKGKGGNELEKQNEEEYSKRFYEKYKDYIKYKRIHKSGSSSYILNKKGRKIAKVN